MRLHQLFEHSKTTNLEERTTGELLKAKLGKWWNDDEYKDAIAWIERTGKSPAQAARMFPGTDARELADILDNKVDQRDTIVGPEFAPDASVEAGYLESSDEEDMDEVETDKGNIYTWTEVNKGYSMYGKFTYEGGEFTMYYDPQMRQFDNREPIEGDPKAQQVIDSLPDEYFANYEKETVISGIIDRILENAATQTEELNDLRKRAGIEVKEGDSTENDCKHCDGLGTHKDKEGADYDCEKCDGTGQINRDEQDEPTDDGSPAYKKYINSTESVKEGMPDQEFADAKEKERLEKHPKKDKIKAVQAMMQKEKDKKKSVNDLRKRAGLEVKDL
jgi:hypothetical protein